MTHKEMVAEFTQMGIDEQILLVEDFWDCIAQKSENLPIPDWHRKILEERQNDHLDPEQCIPWNQVRTQLGLR